MATSFFAESLLNECVLNKNNFEAAISYGNSKKEVLKMFSLSLSPEDLGEGATYAMLDKWCKENYGGLGFNHVYDLLQAAVVKKYQDYLLELGIRGNPSAIAVMNEVILKKENNGIVQINFVNELPAETEEDKENDE